MDVSNNFTIVQGGEINVKGKGYAKSGPRYHREGAGYGGQGGNTGGPTYGSITAPTNLGSGCLYVGYPAGGAVILTIGGTGTIDGTISADGIGGHNFYRPLWLWLAAWSGSLVAIVNIHTSEGTSTKPEN